MNTVIEDTRSARRAANRRRGSSLVSAPPVQLSAEEYNALMAAIAGAVGLPAPLHSIPTLILLLGELREKITEKLTKVLTQAEVDRGARRVAQAALRDFLSRRELEESGVRDLISALEFAEAECDQLRAELARLQTNEEVAS